MPALGSKGESKKTKSESSNGRHRGRSFQLPRRWRYGAISFLILLLIGVPLYATSRPQFYQRFKAVKPLYEAWRVSTHSRMNCGSCHVEPELKNVVVYKLKSIGNFYLSYIAPPAQPGIFVKPSKKVCFQCHTKYRTISPSGDLLIPHRAHVEVLKLKCVYCHWWLVHRKNPKGLNSPPMTKCLKCHDGKQASQACKSCHTEKAYPASHRAADWPKQHSQRTKEINCGDCHGWTPQFCQECHGRRPPSHAGNWKKAHSFPAKARSKGCLVCHKRSKCLTCHDEGLWPKIAVAKGQ